MKPQCKPVSRCKTREKKRLKCLINYEVIYNQFPQYFKIQLHYGWLVLSQDERILFQTDNDICDVTDYFEFCY